MGFIRVSWIFVENCKNLSTKIKTLKNRVLRIFSTPQPDLFYLLSKNVEKCYNFTHRGKRDERSDIESFGESG